MASHGRQLEEVVLEGEGLWRSLAVKSGVHRGDALGEGEHAREVDDSLRGGGHEHPLEPGNRHPAQTGRVAAHLPTGRGHISGLPKAEFLEAIAQLGGTPQHMMRDAALMDLIEPRLRADFALGEHYVYRPGPGLACDCTTLHGLRDHLVIEDRVRRWSDLTSGRVQHHAVDGQHFFLTTHRAEVLGIVGSTLARVLDARKVST